MQLTTQLRELIRTALNLLFPPRCLACRGFVHDHGGLCSVCWNSINFINDPLCGVCGQPLEYGGGEHTLCGECIAHTPPYRRARSVFHYTELSKQLVFHFKYYDNTALAPYLAKWMSRAGTVCLEETDFLIPVPLHRRRLFSRRYNQSAILCHALSKETHIPVLAEGLVRRKHTPPQAGLTRNQRLHNVAGAFAPHPRYKAQWKGKRVTLVDDVMTTGATIHHCTKALLKSGARSVDVLTLGRTVAE
ncbi:MAG: putative phosphoribosyltransferase [Rickettsiales bacterium]|nr:putative phosphoribosyltransferase [Rickettsiales bacterium]